MTTIPERNSDKVRVPKILLLVLILVILVAFALSFTGGCRDKIEASAYSGSLTFSTTLGDVTMKDKENGNRTVVFGNSGLPVEGGREAFVGQVIKLGGGSAKVTSVFTAGPTVTVEYDVSVKLESALLTGTRRDVFTLVGHNKLTVMVHSETTVTNDDGVSAKFVSEGTLVKDLL